MGRITIAVYMLSSALVGAHAVSLSLAVSVVSLRVAAGSPRYSYSTDQLRGREESTPDLTVTTYSFMLSAENGRFPISCDLLLGRIIPSNLVVFHEPLASLYTGSS